MPAATRTGPWSHALVIAGHPWARPEDAASHHGRCGCPSAPTPTSRLPASSARPADAARRRGRGACPSARAMTSMPPACWTRPGDAASHHGRRGCPSAPPPTSMLRASSARPGDAARRRLSALMDPAVHARRRARLDRPRSRPSRRRFGLTFHQPSHAKVVGLAGPCDLGNPCAARTIGCGNPRSQGPAEGRVKAIRIHVSLRPDAQSSWPSFSCSSDVWPIVPCSCRARVKRPSFSCSVEGTPARAKLPRAGARGEIRCEGAGSGPAWQPQGGGSVDVAAAPGRRFVDVAAATAVVSSMSRPQRAWG